MIMTKNKWIAYYALCITIVYCSYLYLHPHECTQAHRMYQYEHECNDELTECLKYPSRGQKFLGN